MDVSGLDASLIIIVIVASLAGSTISGLAGTAFAATSIGIYAHVLRPDLVSPIVVLSSLFCQLIALPLVWRELDWKASAPFVLGGLLGVPVGVYLLSQLDASTFRFAVGVILVLYAATVIISGKAPQIELEDKRADGSVGIAAGVLGGFAGLSGILPTLWCLIRRWPKTRQRSIFQLFNTAMHSATALTYGATGKITSEVGLLMLISIPSLSLGVWLGYRLYRRVDDKLFNRILTILLGVSGLGLVLLER